MPAFPIIDSHVHFYDPARIAHPWLADVPAIAAAHLPVDLARDRGPVDIEQVVFVEVDAAPGRERDEAAFAAAIAAGPPRIGAIVASAPVEKGAAVEADLEALRALPLVKGIRRLIQPHADPAYCLSQLRGGDHRHASSQSVPIAIAASWRCGTCSSHEALGFCPGSAEPPQNRVPRRTEPICDSGLGLRPAHPSYGFASHPSS